MATKEKKYVGLLIRDEIRNQQVKNGFVINRLNQKGFEISETEFSSKIYGERDIFSDDEVTAINEILGTNFKK